MNVYDTAWIMENNEPVMKQVYAVHIKQTANGEGTVTMVSFSKGDIYYDVGTLVRTKQELMEKVFNERTEATV